MFGKEKERRRMAGVEREGVGRERRRGEKPGEVWEEDLNFW